MVGFQDIIGHDEIIHHLKETIRTGKVSHSYIFTGETGSGKKMLAATFAAALQCESLEERPCMVCDSCKKAMGKNHPDIILITHEKPGLISVEEVREQVIHDVSVRPYCSPYKIYIIPDAELMNMQAQNALLKTIEEPPEYAVIMLLTTNAASLLPTIRSRCVELSLSPLPEQLLMRELHSRFPELQNETLKAVYSRSGGYLGQALNLLSGESELAQETEALVRAFASKNRLGLAQVLVPMEKWKRDKLVDALQQWKEVFTQALSCRGGGVAVSPLARELSSGRGPKDLLAAIRQLDKCIEYAQGNVSPAAICGYLIWVL
jgi:DNA polymerase-3 subunit delta'